MRTSYVNRNQAARSDLSCCCHLCAAICFAISKILCPDALQWFALTSPPEYGSTSPSLPPTRPYLFSSIMLAPTSQQHIQRRTCRPSLHHPKQHQLHITTATATTTTPQNGLTKTLAPPDFKAHHARSKMNVGKNVDILVRPPLPSPHHPSSLHKAGKGEEQANTTGTRLMIRLDRPGLHPLPTPVSSPSPPEDC